MRWVALLAVLTGCLAEYSEWEPDRSKPIPVNMVGMTWDEKQLVVDGAEMWNQACGRQVFDVLAPAEPTADAINVTVGETEDGMANTATLSDRVEIEFHLSARTSGLAAHELGHVLIGYAYDGDNHSSDPRSVMHALVLPGSVITAEDADLGCAQ